MTLLYTDRRMLEHQTGRHPERPERLVQIYRHLERTGLDARCQAVAWEPASRERITRVHQADYLERLAQFVAQGGGQIEQDTVVSPASFDVARLAAGAAVDGVLRVMAGPDRQALCLVRPPGHHALPGEAMGFCLLNNVAIAARVAIDELQLDRVLIVDWDVHHGNGTQDMFWADEQVAFFSIHRWPFYPGSGAAEETGTAAGLGRTCNVPVEYGTPPREYRAAFSAELERFADRVRPQLVLISAGFDAHRDDPVGSLDLENEDFAELTKIVQQIAATHAQGRIVSVLEGGYNTSALAGSVEQHLRQLLAEAGSA